MSALALDPHIRVDSIVVEARDGNVVLRGTVGGVAERTDAMRVARDVEGVQRVQDRLKIRIMTASARADADTEAAVLEALIADDVVQSADVDVEARGGSVTLRGIVALESQRERAGRLARQVGAVDRVDDRLQVLVTVSADDVAERITDAIGADAQVGIDQVDVRVDDNDVTLTGWVTSPEHHAAALAAASHTPGVARVHDEIVLRARALRSGDARGARGGG
jgi:osmotically-inducible protein OsmY